MSNTVLIAAAGIDIAAELAPLLENSGLAIERADGVDSMFAIKRAELVPAHRRMLPAIPALLRRQAE